MEVSFLPPGLSLRYTQVMKFHIYYDSLMQYTGRIFESLRQIVHLVQQKRKKLLTPSPLVHVQICTTLSKPIDQQITNKTHRRCQKWAML
jgi:hypothetical protein